jgi:hypothetical protein
MTDDAAFAAVGEPGAAPARLGLTIPPLIRADEVIDGSGDVRSWARSGVRSHKMPGLERWRYF